MADLSELLNRSIARARRRLLPFLLLMYVVSVLDRTNVAFAKQDLQSSRGVSEAAYALGAGLFFLTYALFEIPGNLLMYRVGARIWLSRIMVVWGLISAATMFVAGERSFYCLRLLLGAAEAGFFPGVILYLTYWFPNKARGQVLGLFYFGAPLSFIVGSPLSGLLLGMRPMLGLQGWQWMFLIEGLVAVAVGIAVFLVLKDGPADAPWLSDAERDLLQKTLSAEEKERRARGPSSLVELFKNPRILYLSATYFMIQAGVYGVIFYLPTEVAAILGRKVGLEVGLVSAIPWVFAIAATFLFSRAAARYSNHHLLASLGLVASGCAILAVPLSPAGIALLTLCIAASGYIAVQPLFWTFPTAYLSGASAAAGIAMINSFGNIGGFVAPNIKVAAEIHFKSKFAGALALASITFLGALLLALMRNQKPVSTLHEVVTETF
jgi:MFS family permease